MLAQNARQKSASVEDRKMVTLPGASPRRYGAPITIVQYYLDRNFGNTEESHAQGGGTIVRAID
jgi:hypothetical protein